MTDGWRIDVDGLGFPEGLVPEGEGIAFVDLLHQRIASFVPGRPVRELARVEGAPNGMRRGPDGALWIANNGGLSPGHDKVLVHHDDAVSGRIQRLAAGDRAVTDEIVELERGVRSRPNDLVFAPDGGVVFTDPGNWEHISDPQRYSGGALYSGMARGPAVRAREVPGFVNGLAFHPDGSLIVAVTLERRLLRFAWPGTGRTLSEPEEFCDLSLTGAEPDGVWLHGDRFFVAGAYADNVVSVTLDGRIDQVWPTGADTGPTNLCVAHGRLWVGLGFAGHIVSRPL